MISRGWGDGGGGDLGGGWGVVVMKKGSDGYGISFCGGENNLELNELEM